MTQLIEDYALIGNNATCALVSRDGSIDWLCFPRFDSAACFAALLGTDRNGRWKIAPNAEHPGVKRRYRGNTLVLETEFTTPEGAVLLTDCMDRHGDQQHVIRLVRGISGRVPMHMELVMRLGYGTVVPWVTQLEDGRLQLVAGSDRLTLATSAPTRGEDKLTRADFEVAAGDEIPFVLTWNNSYSPLPKQPDASQSIENVVHAWEKWSAQHIPDGPYGDAVLRSLITLKALMHRDTGGIVAAATTSLPEEIGGIRNWDYRFCWLRDSTFTLYALLEAGFTQEAHEWRDWLLRSVAGSPDQIQIMYGVAGERRLTEFELDHLSGYEGSRPVRVGNAASQQFQLDVFGEVLDSFYMARKKGMKKLEPAWNLQKALIQHVEQVWEEPDEGIWEVRGGRKHFVLSKVMAWVALDRAVRTIEDFGEDGPVERWRKVRSEIHDEVCRLGFSREKNAFVQFFGGKCLDASTLMIPLVGFLPADDPRVRGTIAAVEKHLMRGGLVQRYIPETAVDGLRGSEGVFLACSFWLADNYVLQGRMEEAHELFERLLSLRNDVGLLSEEYDPEECRMLGNFPQAFSHLALVNSAHNLYKTSERKPAHHRSRR
ncbi:MAG: glycoside hydrolase family 15 protein [Bryobacteraceae bacterium]